MTDIGSIVALSIFAAVTIYSAHRRWDGMVLIFGLSALLIGCKLGGV